MEQQKKETVLIVDDSRFHRTVLKATLTEYFDVLEAGNGKECLSIIENPQNDIDLVLLDLVMPEMDGFEVLKRRQNMENFKKIPVIVLSTSQSIEFQTQAFELGAHDYIIKPVDARIAITRINNAISTVRHLQTALSEQNEWRQRSQIDEMTNLLNKAATEKFVKEELENHPEEEHALMLVDIDNFKSVNDNLGHKVGDHVITVVAGVLTSTFGDADIIGRIGGDEFLVMVPRVTSHDRVLEKADKLVGVIRDKENLSIPNVISISVGVAFSEKNENYEALFTRTDEALYDSKKAGKGRYTAYGESCPLPEGLNIVVAWSNSRNVTSTLTFELPNLFELKAVATFDEFKAQLEEDTDAVKGCFVDVSECDDFGKLVWKQIRNDELAKSKPITAICQEGNLEQILLAVESGVIDDLIFAPLEPAVLKRRIRVHISRYS